MAYQNERSAIHAAKLIHKQLSSKLTHKEQQVLEMWLNASDENKRVYEELMQGGDPHRLLDRIANYKSEASLERMLSKLENKTTHHWKLLLPLASAAIIVLAIGIGLSAVNWQPHRSYTGIVQEEADVGPGGNRAFLTLPNGSTIPLNGDQAGIEHQGGGLVYLDGSGVVAREQGAQTADALPLTLQTPRGGQYQVVLPDGTKVWLNAASSLTYPAKFSDKERQVELIGEAYFEVARNEQQPFVVKTGGQAIRVLGTAFNIKAYPDEQAAFTTLVSGRVQVQYEGKIETLMPGQQATATEHAIGIHHVDIEHYIAWKNGLIVLQEADLHAVIRQIERWYDVEFILSDKLPADVNINGKLPRDTPLSGILEALEINTGLKFKLTGRRVTMSSS